jgi:hypothetical protein
LKTRSAVLGSLAGLCVLFVLAYTGLRLYNHFTLQSVMDKILAECPNKEIRIDARYRGYYDTGTLIFDVRRAAGSDAAMTGMDLFFELASRTQKKDFDTVKMCYRGRPMLFVDGAVFRNLGRQFGHEDVNKLLGDMAGAATLPDGKPLRTLDRRVLARLMEATVARGKRTDR